MSNAPVFKSTDLSSNRYSALPASTLQVVCFYDGKGSAALSFETEDSSGNRSWTTIKDIVKFDTKITTAEYSIEGCTPTGNFVVEGVTADGVVDGLAFGLLWRDARSCYHILRSNSSSLVSAACFVSAWPLGMNNTVFAPRVPQMTDGYARETALAVISGAKLVANGKHELTVY